MLAIYDETAMKKATNVTISSDLLQKAKRRSEIVDALDFLVNGF